MTEICTQKSVLHFVYVQYTFLCAFSLRAPDLRLWERFRCQRRLFR